VQIAEPMLRGRETCATAALRLIQRALRALLISVAPETQVARTAFHDELTGQMKPPRPWPGGGPAGNTAHPFDTSHLAG
jgi:hypothetical protein